MPVFLVQDVVDVLVVDVVDMEVVKDLPEAKFGLDAGSAQPVEAVAVAAFDVGQACL
jgi:hypothetical protein